MSNKSEYAIYVLKGNNPTFFFSGYKDKTGDEQFIPGGKDEKGNERKKKFEFVDGNLRIHKSKKDDVAFIDNSPWCEGSPNLKGKPAFYKLDIEATAKKRVNSKKDIIKATAAAIELKGEMLEMVSIICGGFTESKEMQMDIVISYAERNPMDFLNLVDKKNLEDLQCRAFLRRAVKAHVVKMQGPMYIWEGVRLGTSEDDAIAKLISDPDLFTSVQEVYKAKGGKIVSNVVAEPPNREQQTSVKARNQKVKV